MTNDIPGFTLQARLKSFSYSFAGLKQLLRSEHNARVHIAFTVLIVPNPGARMACRLCALPPCALLLVFTANKIYLLQKH